MPSSTIHSDHDTSPVPATHQDAADDPKDDSEADDAQTAETVTAEAPTEAPPDIAPTEDAPTEDAPTEDAPTEDAPTDAPAAKVGKTPEEPARKPSAAAKSRTRSSAKRTEPTLFHDFLLGRPSAARVEAERKRRESVEALKAELRQEMKQSQVRKLQQPNSVKARVKAWQKANAAAIAAGKAEDAATEPPDVAFNEEDFVSVTEEDRIRIKMRQKKRGGKAKNHNHGHDSKSHPKNNNNNNNNSSSPSKGGGANHTDDETSSRPPRRRIVSDDHWVKTKTRKVSVRKVSPRPRKSATAARMPSGYAFRASPNPSVSNKVKAWADKVEMMPPPRSVVSSGKTALSVPDEESSDGDDTTASRDTARKSAKTAELRDDGMGGVVPLGKPQESSWPDETRLQPPRRFDDDEIRVRPLSAAGSDKSTPRLPGSPVVGSRSKTMSAPSTNSTILENLIKAVEEATELSRLTDDVDSYLDAPIKRRRSKSQPAVKRGSRTRLRSKSLSEDSETAHSDDVTIYSANHPPSTIKSVADIPGEIPFGHSAFSELDLPVREPSRRARARPRAKVDRSTSLRGMPNVLKKVVEEGKKMLQDMNEPARQVVPNNPPSIEKWLSSTVEALEGGKGSLRPLDDDLTDVEPKKKSAKQGTSHEAASSVADTATTVTDAPMPDSVRSTTPKASRSTTKTSRSHESSRRNQTPPSGLKRSRATTKSSGKRPLLGVLKEAFQGESSGHVQPAKSYQSHEERRYEEGDEESAYLNSRSSSDLHSRSNSDLGSWVTESRSSEGVARRAPTGSHELSTIMSEGNESDGTESTVTRDGTARDSTKNKKKKSTTSLQRGSGLGRAVSKQSGVSNKSAASLQRRDSGLKRQLSQDSDASKSDASLQRRGSGLKRQFSKDSDRSLHRNGSLKRRLTKHSDLVSVLSAPDDSTVPERIKSNRSRASIRRARGGSGVSNEELLREFIEDENLYRRELKTLVDGVIPVLLSHVMGNLTGSELFGPASARERVESMSKAVVNMGVCLDKLKHAHQKVTATDLRKLAHWAHGVVPMYSNYLTAWRSGFQDLVVNLAPREDVEEEEDSLFNLLPRNEIGDLLNADGERVAVAYLLKRPLIRIKQLSKLMECIDSMYRTQDTGDLLRDLEALQEKSRQRCREEAARLVDEEALGTDKTRARDLRTLSAARFVGIDGGRQVNAKDTFSLELAHSNGQRLECQVELVHRDKQGDPRDEGDLLIREVGDGNRTYLLFPPVSMGMVSARKGEGKLDMVVMVRGEGWYELLTLWADDEEQVLDWLDILPPSPVPGRQREGSVVSAVSNPFRDPDGPIGAQSVVVTEPAEDAAPLGSAPGEKGDTRETLEWEPGDDAAKSEPEDVKRVEDAVDTKKGPYKTADGAPPPPIHRTLSASPQQKKSQSLKPPVDLKGAVKRRTSSPLKHEYLPSDVSSASASEISTATEGAQAEGDEQDEEEDDSGDESEEDDDTETETEEGVEFEGETDSESSDDGLESLDDIPQTELGFSIRDDRRKSFMASECSLTPSNSASQAGLHGRKAAREDRNRHTASISRWTDKGAWKDVWMEPCSVAVMDGLIEAYADDTEGGKEGSIPLLAMDLTPLVLIRQSTAVDLEIRSSLQGHCKLAQRYSGGNFRFRCATSADCYNLYMTVHHARLHNQKFIQLENESRFRGFGERGQQGMGSGGRGGEGGGRGEGEGRRRSWFGRRNSYRGSVRAPSQDGLSTTPSSASATSFLRRLTLVGNFSFNLARSSVGKGAMSSSSSGSTPPDSLSGFGGGSGGLSSGVQGQGIAVRLHLLVSATKWEDQGECRLQIRRPPAGWHQALRADHGMEKRVTVTAGKGGKGAVLLDAVLGSGCFSPMGTRGIVCGVWEGMRGDKAGATGPTGGNIKKWCFQFGSVGEANWVLRMVHQEVVTAMDTR